MNADSKNLMPETNQQRLPGPDFSLVIPHSDHSTEVLAALAIQIAVLDRHGDIVFTNRAWDVFGCDTHEQKPNCGVGANYFDACRSTTGDDAKLAQEVLHGLKAVAAGELQEFSLDYPCNTPTQQRWFLLQATPSPSADGRIVVSHTNITSRKRIESELEQSRSRLAAALASMTDAVFISDRDGRFVEFNDAFASFHRFADKHQCRVLLSDYQDILEVYFQNGEVAPLTQWAVPRALRGETHTNAIYTLRRRDTGARWIGSYSYAPVRKADGEIIGAVVVARDVTEAMHAEQALRGREARWQAVLDSAMDAIIVADGKGTVTHINPATEQMFGYAPVELIGSGGSILFSDATRSDFLRRLDVLKGIQLLGSRHELMARRKNGETFPVEVVFNAIAGGGYAAVIRDDTEREKARRRMLEIAAEEQRQIGQDLHDGIQQELTGLSLFSSAIVEALSMPARNGATVDLPWLRNAATRIYDGLESVHSHVQQFARGIMPVQIDAEGLQAALAALVEQTNAPRLVCCQFVCPATVTVSNNATATHLYRIAQEALNNALRHAAPRNVVVSLLRDRNYVVLSVSDDGMGIDAALSANNAMSAGAGLQTMKYRARAIGGILTVARQDQGGTLVRCDLLQEPA